MESKTHSVQCTKQEDLSSNRLRACLRLGTRTLLSLPPELLIQISDFLPSSSTASFALCNKHLTSLLGSKSWISLRSDPNPEQTQQRIHFLTLLSRDLPSQYACHTCLILHSSSSVPVPGNPTARYQPNRCTYDSTPSLHSCFAHESLHISNYIASYSLLFSHVQLALKRHKYGPKHGIPLQDLAYKELRLFNRDAYFFSVEARISPAPATPSYSGPESDEPQLLLRSQEWIVSTSRSVKQEFESRRVRHAVCPHLMTYNGEFGLDDTLTILLRCRLSHESEAEPKSKSRSKSEFKSGSKLKLGSGIGGRTLASI